MVHQVGRHRAAAQTLLPATVALTDHNNVALVVVNNLEERSASLTVENMHGDAVALFLEFLAVGVHPLHSLVTQLLEKLILLLAVDSQGTRDPGTTQDISRKNSHKENMAVSAEGLLVQDVVEGQVTSLRTVQGKENLELVIGHIVTNVTHNVLVAGLRRNRQLVEGVTRLKNGRLGNGVHAITC